jgi:hypothetical protein
VERKEEVRVALEIRTSLRPERPGTTPEGDKKQRESSERERKRTDNPDQKTDRNKGEEKANPNKKERQKHQQNKKGTRRAEAQQRQGKRGEKQEREGGAKIVTPSVPISEWPGEQGLGLKDQGATMKQLERRGTDSPDQSAARKARYQLKENNQENTSTGKDRRQGDVKPMNRQ